MRVVLIAFLAGIYLFNVFELRQWMEAEIPTGPDQQCYHRQAQLFAESGIIGGLDTAVTFEGASYLISKAKAFGLLATPEPGWIAAVAPECHRYKSATGKIISQYPPGTGFLLSLFPDGRRVRLLYIVIETIILGWFAYLLWFARNIAASLLVCALGCFAVIQLNYEGYMSFSLAPSMLLCLLLAFCTVKMLTCETRRKQALFAAICGGLIGVSVSMRTANILLAGGYAFAFLPYQLNTFVIFFVGVAGGYPKLRLAAFGSIGFAEQVLHQQVVNYMVIIVAHLYNSLTGVKSPVKIRPV